MKKQHLNKLNITITGLIYIISIKQISIIIKMNFNVTLYLIVYTCQFNIENKNTLQTHAINRQTEENWLNRY